MTVFDGLIFVRAIAGIAILSCLLAVNKNNPYSIDDE